MNKKKLIEFQETYKIGLQKKASLRGILFYLFHSIF